MNHFLKHKHTRIACTVSGVILSVMVSFPVSASKLINTMGPYLMPGFATTKVTGYNPNLERAYVNAKEDATRLCRDKFNNSWTGAVNFHDTSRMTYYCFHWAK